MNRRGFFAALAGMAAVATDPERLLWTPGKRLISIPRPPVELVNHHFAVDFEVSEEDIAGPLAEFEARYVTPALESLASRIENEILRNLNHPRLVPLGPPFGVTSKQISNGRVEHARVTIVPDFYAGPMRLLGRVDCLLRGGERRWNQKIEAFVAS